MQIRWLTGPPDELNLLLFAPTASLEPKYGRRNARNWTICAGQPSLASQF